MTALAGMPRVRSGMKEPPGSGVVGRLGSGHPLDGPVAELLRVSLDTFFSIA